LRPLFDANGYEGVDPVADGYLRFESDGTGGTKVMFDPDGPATGNRWPFLIVTLDHVQPSGVHTGDWLYA
jgi:serralysin